MRVHRYSGVGRLPLTTAIIDGLVVLVGDERLIIPTLVVVRLVRCDKSRITTVAGKGELFENNGRLLPIVRLRDALGTNGSKEPAESVFVIVSVNGKEASLEVDAILGKQEVVIKSIQGTSYSTKGIAGGAVLGDGTVGLILNVKDFVDTLGEQ